MFHALVVQCVDLLDTCWCFCSSGVEVSERLVSSGNHEGVCPTLLEAEEGEDVSLWCRLVPSVDLKDLTLEVTRTDVDKEVYVCRLGKEIAEEQSSQYKHRTRLRQDSITGTFTLTISSVNTSDSGTYQWYSPQHEAMCRFNLTVGKK